MARARSCLVRCITDTPEKESYVQAERHDCEECSPGAWVIINMVAPTYGVDDAAVHLRTSDARKLGLAMVRMGTGKDSSNGED